MPSSTESTGKTNDSHSSLSSTLRLMLLRPGSSGRNQTCNPKILLSYQHYHHYSVHRFVEDSGACMWNTTKARGNYDFTIIGCCSKAFSCQGQPCIISATYQHVNIKLIASLRLSAASWSCSSAVDP